MYDVIIVGAGVAGLSAANKLFREGKSFLVVEAKNRIGGRVNTTEFGRVEDGQKLGVVELGANWIHFPVGNPVCKLGHEAGILKEPYISQCRVDDPVRTEEGKILDEFLSRKFWKIYQQIENEKHTDKLCSLEADKNSLLDFLKFRMEKEVEKIHVDNQEDMRRVFQVGLNYLSFHDGDDLDKVSLISAGEPDHYPGGNIKIPGGYSNIFRHLIKNFAPSNLVLETTVEHIAMNSEFMTTRCRQQNKTIEYQSKFVIFTSSLGVLKAFHEKMFSPSLPPEKICAVNKIGFGKVEKIFLFFDTPFWERGKGSFKLCWDKGRYEFQGSECPWWNCIFGFDEVLDNPNVLLAWISGSGVIPLLTLSDEEVGTKCAELLRRFCNNPCIPNPSKILRSTWKTDACFLGSYSYVHTKSSYDDFVAMSLPVCDAYNVPRLCFAGEATHIFYATTHGAFLSGEREAERMLSFLDLPLS